LRRKGDFFEKFRVHPLFKHTYFWYNLYPLYYYTQKNDKKQQKTTKNDKNKELFNKYIDGHSDLDFFHKEETRITTRF